MAIKGPDLSQGDWSRSRNSCFAIASAGHAWLSFKGQDLLILDGMDSVILSCFLLFLFVCHDLQTTKELGIVVCKSSGVACSGLAYICMSCFVGETRFKALAGDTSLCCLLADRLSMTR